MCPNVFVPSAAKTRPLLVPSPAAVGDPRPTLVARVIAVRRSFDVVEEAVEERGADGLVVVAGVIALG